MEVPATRRVTALQRHLQVPDAACTSGGVSAEGTSASTQDVTYSVVLPEHLTPGGPWLVHRFGFDRTSVCHACALECDGDQYRGAWLPAQVGPFTGAFKGHLRAAL